MTIYHLEFAKTGNGLSGGEVSMLEFVNYYSSKKIKNVIMTTDNGQSIYESYLGKNEFVEYRTVQSQIIERKYGVLISYLYRMRLIKKFINKSSFNISDNDIIFCHSEFFPNSISYHWMLKKYKNIRSAAFYHMRSPKLWKGYEGEFTGKYQIPRLTIAHYIANQLLYRLLTNKQTKIFTVNPFYTNYLKKKYPKNEVYVLENYGGGLKVSTTPITKTTDLLWIGRFHRQKGILDFIKVVKRVKEEVSNVSVLMAGDGDKDLKQKVIDDIKKYGLESNIKMPGFLTGDKKRAAFEETKVFVMTSHYESFGLVIVEAMSASCAVVAYDLPVYKVFKENIQRAKILNTNSMADKIINMLKNKETLVNWQRISKEASLNHSWGKTAQFVLDQF